MSLDTKNKGQVYTPISIVNMMLDYAGYIPSLHIIDKHVMDNSCGDGRILGEVVKRYIQVADKIMDGEIIRRNLGKYIHGIEYDSGVRWECIEYLNSILKEHNLEPIIWDIRCGNALDLTIADPYLYNMDYVFGNPPYVRMKNIKKADETNEDYQILKKYSFAEKGMSDLYLAFYQLGMTMCKNGSGVMCYIAPSAWINSQSGKTMRGYIRNSKFLSSVIDFEHTQVFDGATTYVMITLFEMIPHKFVRYDKYDDDTKEYYPDKIIPYERLFVDDRMFFVSESDYEVIKEVFKPHKKLVEVKNGYATLADDVFIDNLPEFEHYTIPVVKGSTCTLKRCLFPYDKDLKLIPLETIKETDPKVYEYLLENKETLQKRDYDSKGIEDTWHSLGRSQGLKDTYTKRIGINTLVREPKNLRMYYLNEGFGIYSGLYIKTDLPVERICEVLDGSWAFIDYVKSLRKYKSGGYYTFSSKDLEKYLNYKLENYEECKENRSDASKEGGDRTSGISWD